MGTRRIKFNTDTFIALSFSWEVGEEIPSHYVIPHSRTAACWRDIWTASREVEKLAYIFQFNDCTQKGMKQKKRNIS